MRITIKGGVWKNTEDEILKAAVMKYGKNQWSRISSLLVRKSAKQCKARWYEWLDPSIKKTEWSREEEEKLLHLAKIMPTQWRTIAPLIGRTAAQCLEHYEKLLDAAQQKEDVDAKDDPRRLKPGEIDPHPETKPARPDPVDMDEDEKEMLSEARARLANTKGKKAKRKAREKQLEEARRLANLQKRRELRAAGIDLKMRKRRHDDGIDYLNEIPFEARPLPGFYDTTEEKKLSIKLRKEAAFRPVDLQELEGKRRDAEEERERKKDAKRQRIFREDNLPEHLKKINELNDPQQILRRQKLMMPAPQVSDRELDDIAKLSEQNQLALPAPGDNAATRTLLANYGSATPLPTPQRTQRTPMARDTILTETQNLLALTQAQTPLKGGENAALTPMDFSGITPKSRVAATPNALLGNATPGGATPRRTPARTPATGLRTPGAATPLRDGLQINSEGGMTAAEALAATSARAEKRRQATLKKKLASSLASLPAAVNEYALVMPELPPDLNANQNHEAWEEDAEDAQLRQRAELSAKEQALLRARSQVLQKELPRPVTINAQVSDKVASEMGVWELVQSELLAMLRHDNAKYPVDGRKASKKVPRLESYSDADMSVVRKLVEAEVGQAYAETEEQTQQHQAAWEASAKSLIFMPATKSFGVLSEAKTEEQLRALKQEFELSRGQADVREKEAAKLEQKVSILVGGYQQRAKTLQNEIQQLHNTLSQSQSELQCFSMLLKQEEEAIPRRIEKLKREVDEQAFMEKQLQARYSDLLREMESLQANAASSS